MTSCEGKIFECAADSCISCSTRCHRQQSDPTPADKALSLLFQQADFSLAVEMLPVGQALRRVTAENVYAALSVPSVRCAQHDGAAVCRKDAKQFLATGMPLPKNSFFRCRMGNALPTGFDTVVPAERVTFSGETAVLSALPGQYCGTYAPGSSVTEGELLVSAGHRLTPANLAVLRIAGVETLPVWERPSAVILPIGSDLVNPGTTPGPGQHTECDSLLLSAIWEECGGTAKVLPILPDDSSVIAETAGTAAEHTALIILIGGMGRGGCEYGDYTVKAVELAGKLLVQGTDFGPGGKAQFFGIIRGKPVIGIPGPPHAALTQGERYLPAVMEHFLGCCSYGGPRLTATLSKAFSQPVHGSYHPHVQVCVTKEGLEARPVRMGETTDCFVRSNAMLIHSGTVAPGEKVPVQLLTVNPD